MLPTTETRHRFASAEVSSTIPLSTSVPAVKTANLPYTALVSAIGLTVEPSASVAVPDTDIAVTPLAATIGATVLPAPSTNVVALMLPPASVNWFPTEVASAPIVNVLNSSIYKLAPC